jgi:TolA-binding protein
MRRFDMKKLFSAALMLALCCSVAMAQQEGKNGPGIADWLKRLQNKIAQIMPKKTVPLSTGVAGIRGAKEDSPVKLYWKGKEGEEAVTEEEVAKFRAGVDLAEKGDNEGSLKQLDEFMKQYPDSALIPDAKKTFDMVKAEPKPAEQAAPKERKKEETK